MQSDDRARVILFLSLLGNPGSADRLGQTNDTERAAMELCRLWIEEIYAPGLRNLDGLKGNRDPRRVERFNASFSPTERDHLYRFHRFLELRLEMLPKRTSEDRAFPGGEFWLNILRHARNVLADIDPEGLELEEILRSGRTLME